MEVGQYKSGEKRYEIRHFNDLKLAHPESMAAPASRPTLGRPPKNPSAPAEHQTSTEASEEALPASSPELNRFPNPTSLSGPPPVPFAAQPVKINKTVDTSSAGNSNRPVRSTRNPAPIYVDALHKPWSASQLEINALNRAINFGAV